MVETYKPTSATRDTGGLREGEWGVSQDKSNVAWKDTRKGKVTEGHWCAIQMQFGETRLLWYGSSWPQKHLANPKGQDPYFDPARTL